MHPGKLDKKIEILERIIDTSPSGDEIIKTKKKRTCFANAESKITKALIEDNRFISSVEVNFTILNCKNFEISTEKYIIRWNNKFFKIIDIADETPYLKIITKEEHGTDYI